MKQPYLIIAGVLALALLAGCAPAEQTPAALTEVTLMLDWVPNTNHTGILIAQDRGYFTEAGLDVTIIQPGEVYPEAAVASGVAEFGISFQEYVTLARADAAPIVSVAAIIQSNSSGFASPAALGVESPADFEGLRYGSFGTPFEEPTLRVLMECVGANFGQVEVVNTGFSDPLALMQEGQIDFAWIFYGWQGFQAQQQGIDLNYVMLADHFDCIPDYYTPVLISSESLIASDPATVAALVGALSRGYADAAADPAAAAETMVEMVPELDPDLVRSSLEWLAPRFQGEADQWGYQQLSVWEGYTAWMVENGILAEPIDAAAAFSNEFLPQ